MSMTTIGDGIVALAIAGGIVSYLAIKYARWQKRVDVVHQERMAAMEKGIPLPEFPLDLMEEKPRGPEPPVIPILGIILFTLSIGTMIVLYLVLPAASHSFWIAPLPLAFMGVGLVVLHALGIGRR
ncbi:MAG TPA: hypothetical protein VF742_07840 [Terracidiphilus sp.]|jgi:hypothetical protein